ncbi:MAG TPA: peptidase M61 [Caulobacteraceae bacterium]|nr:peptidase M61 [Caulobacteraceae bacterium]
MRRIAGTQQRPSPRSLASASSLAFLVALLWAPEAQAAAAAPQPARRAPAIAAPRDVPFPGVIEIAVDATDLDHGVFSVRERMPARPGPLTLLYPKWIPGHHAPEGAIDRLADLTVRAGGEPLPWRRDPVDMYAFHLRVPPGASSLDIVFQYLSPVAANEGDVAMSPDMLNLDWSTVVLYPAGYFARRIEMRPSVKLPAGFAFATALERSSVSGGVASFAPASLNLLVDSPLVAGRYFRRIDLDGGAKPARLDVFADRPEELAATQAEIAAHRALVTQADRLFGARHFDHYDFLLWLSDRTAEEGLEHHQSSQDGTKPKYFTDWDKLAPERDLLPHEYAHSWNGKYRRPADLWTPNFNVPMRDSLLWVYEGLTQYWGYVLAARAGLWTRDDALAAIALTAASQAHRPGRTWRDLEDTTNAPIIAMRRPQPWINWQRGEDYYSEGLLLWLDVDTLIRQRSAGARSLDDFARAFFGAPASGPVTRTYTVADLEAALNAVEPYDWAGFFASRLKGYGPGAPLDGLGRGGYRLAYGETETPFEKNDEADNDYTDFLFSLGFDVGKSNELQTVLWDSPAFAAGLRAGTTLVAVNGDAYDADALEEAIAGAKSSAAPIQLLVKQDNRYRTVAVDYHGGPKYPRLDPAPGARRWLDEILKARP